MRKAESKRQSPHLVHVTTVPASLKAFFQGQIAFMKAQGFNISGISSPGPHLDDFQQREGIEFRGITITRKINPIADLVSLVFLFIQIRRWRPTILHAHTPKGGLLGMVSAWTARVPVRIYHLRGLPLETATGWKRWLLWTSESVACLLADRVFCISESLRQRVLDLSICPSNKIRVLGKGSGNGVDVVNRFNPKRFDSKCVRRKLGIGDNSLVIGFVGRIARDKGIEDLARSWKMLSASRPDLRWIIVGDLDERDPIPQTLYRQLREDPGVQILGFVDDATEYYVAMDVCVLPTFREGFGNVLLEAASMRVPVVATRVTGCVDAVADGVNGMLVSPHNHVELAHAIARYLDDDQLRHDHGAAGRRRMICDFQPVYLWREILENYEALMRQKGITLQREESLFDQKKAA